MIDVSQCIEAAEQACQQAGQAPNRARFHALNGVAELLLKKATGLSLAADHADCPHAYRRDKQAADRLRQLAMDLATEADGLALEAE